MSNSGFLWLCFAGDLVGVRAAIARGDDVNVRDKDAYTGINYATRAGRVHVVAALMRCPAFSRANIHRRNLMTTACANGHLALAQFFARLGWSRTAVEEDGTSPLSAALAGGHVEVVRFLLDGLVTCPPPAVRGDIANVALLGEPVCPTCAYYRATCRAACAHYCCERCLNTLQGHACRRCTAD